jgi:hypothetical protein
MTLQSVTLIKIKSNGLKKNKRITSVPHTRGHCVFPRLRYGVIEGIGLLSQPFEPKNWFEGFANHRFFIEIHTFNRF